jgi:GTP-binding protein
LDLRHDPQPIDLEFMEYLHDQQIPFCLVFTKADKLKPGAQDRQVQNYLAGMQAAGWAETPPYFITSSTHGSGKEALLSYIGSVNEDFKKSQRDQRY